MKILIATEKPFAAVAVDGMKKVIEASANELVLLEKGTKADLISAVEDADGLIIRSDIVDSEVIASANNLKVIVRAGAGYDNIDLAAATEKGICVMNTPGQNSNAVAELVFGMLVMMMRNKYDGTSGYELKGRSLGIHAYGQVGR
ncbi:MAG: 3-phosphoglycerate dehydrogenase, partial [Bacteroidales bacterium]